VTAALAAQKEAVAAALAASDKAVDKAEATAEKWRANANEWRGAMSDRDRELPSRKEVEAWNVSFEARVARLEALSERQVGKSQGIELSGGLLTAALAAVTSIVIAVVIVANALAGS